MNFFSRIITLPIALLTVSLALAGDDIDFAKGLARDGFVQQAEEVCKRIESGADAKEKAAVPLVRAEIAARRASSAGTLAEARAELAKGAAALDAFISANPGHPRECEALMEAGLLRRQCGEVAEQEIRDGGPAAAGEQGRAELEKGLNNLNSAGAIATARSKEIEGRLGGKPAQGADAKALEEAQGQAAEAPYQAARCLHLRARLEGDPAAKKAWLEKALAAFVDLEFDLGETPLVQEASLTWALVLRDLGRPRESLGRFEVAWNVTAPWRDKIVAGPLPAWEREVASRAASGRAETLTASGDPAAALDAVEALLKLAPDAARDRSGFLAVIEKGNALAALGRRGEAAALATKLMETAPNPTLRELASRKVVEWGGPGGVAAQRIVADAAYSAANWQGAWDGYRAVLAASEGPDGDLLWKLALCAEHLERRWDAVVLYETVAFDFPACTNASSAAFRAAHIWSAFASAAGDGGKWEREQVDKMLRLLTERWPADPNAQNAMYLVADAALERGEFEKAALTFERVPEDANMRLKAVAMAGWAWFRCASELWNDAARREESKATFARAETRFAEALKAAGAAGPRGASVAAFVQLKLAEALLHPQNPRPAAAVKLLEEAAATPGSDSRSIGLAMIDARMANGELAKAAAVASDLSHRFRANAPVGKACRRVGEACDMAAEQEPVGADGLRASAIELYEASVRIGLATQSPRPDAAALADRSLGLALKLNGLSSDTSVDNAPDTLPHPEALRLAARLAEGAGSGTPPAGWTADARLGPALGLSGDLEGSRDAWGRLVEDAGVVRDGKFNAAAVAGRGPVLAAYEELGFVHLKLALMGTHRAASFDAAYVVFANLVEACAPGSRTWWRCKVGALRVLAERGKPGDFDTAVAGLSDLKSNHPDLDEGKFGIEGKVKALEKLLAEKGSKGK